MPEPFSTESFTLDVYRYKDSLKEDLQQADLVISHAGKGSENLGGGGSGFLKKQHTLFLIEFERARYSVVRYMLSMGTALAVGYTCDYSM